MSVDEEAAKELVETLRDGQDGYAKGAEKLDGSDKPAAAAAFRRFSEQRASFATELEAMGHAYGDDIDESGTLAAKVHRGWMGLKDALTGSGSDAVLKAAVTGEDHAVKEYEKALGQDLSANLRTVVERQLEGIKAARAEVVALEG